MLLQCKGTTGEQVVYVNEAGLIVLAPVINKTCRDTNCWRKKARKKDGLASFP